MKRRVRMTPAKTNKLLPVAIMVVFAMLFTCSNSVASAQADFEKGFQAYQSYHGSDFDTVNLANGNLILDIPLLSYEQRGGLPPIVVSIRSNSTTFQSTPPYVSGPLDTQQHEVASGVVGSPWGQPHVSISPGGLSWKEERIVTSSHTGAGGPEYLTRFVALDESGASHSLGGNVANLLQGVVPDIRYSVDGSGLMLQPGTAPTGQLIVDRQGSIGGLVDVHGNAITLHGQCATAPGTGDLFNASLAAWEGYAHGTASATTITDSVGRVIPNPSYLPPAISYSCLIDMDASYHPAAPSGAGCETWSFPAQGTPSQSGIQAGATIPLVFCYEQIPINAQIPIPLPAGSPIPGGGGNTYACSVLGGVNKNSCETINETWWVLSSVTLPNQTKWQFAYDLYGQVSSVTLPTGATVSYTYQTRLACGNPPGQIPVSGTPVWPYSNIMSTRMVTSRTVDLHDGADPTRTMTWNYSSTLGSGWAGSPDSGTVTVTDPALNDVVHTFGLIGQCVCGPYETKTQYYQGSAKQYGTLLKEVDTAYTNTGTDFANPTNFSNYISVGVFANTVTTTMPGSSTSSVVSQDTYTYDTLGTYQDYVGDTHLYSFGQLLASTESDWGSGASGPVLRTTLHSHQWQSDWTYYAANLIDLPCLDTVITGPSQVTQYSCAPTSPVGAASQTSYKYDEGSFSYTGSLGNPTTVSHWLRGGVSPQTHNMYASTSFGMPIQKIDANGNATLLTYDSTGLFLGKIEHPSTNGVSHVEYPTYDGNTGLLISNIDENSNTTGYQYDPMRRLTHISFPDTGWETYTYNDDAPLTYIEGSPTPAFTYTKGLNGSQTYTAMGFVDELGRNRQTQVVDPEGNINKDTTYDILGRVYSVSNPYRSKADVTYGLTSYTYDALSRKLYQYQQDGVNYLQWVYAGNSTTSYDELHNPWQRTSDGLGRLANVVEPGGLNTTYSYDALGNLLCADQWGTSAPSNSMSCTSSRWRKFTYDSLSRLLTSTNPETGTICYGQGSLCAGGYDPNGNLLAKTDARGITVDYTYDALNRLLSKSYVNDTTGTPSSCYQYDQSALAGGGANLIGRLTNQWTQVGACAGSAPAVPKSIALSQRSILAYDSMGRILTEQQCTFANCSTSNPYTPTYDYDLAGNVIHHTSGIASGKGTMNFTNCYDSVSRLSLVVGLSTQCQSLNTSASLFAVPTYSPAGGLTAATFGTGLKLSRTYDVRLRISGETDSGGGGAQSATPGTATFQILQH